jgi:hypothetical protein
MGWPTDECWRDTRITLWFDPDGRGTNTNVLFLLETRA